METYNSEGTKSAGARQDGSDQWLISTFRLVCPNLSLCKLFGLAALAIATILVTYQARAQYTANQFVEFPPDYGNFVIVGVVNCDPPYIPCNSSNYGNGVLSVTGSASLPAITVGGGFYVQETSPGELNVTGQLTTSALVVGTNNAGTATVSNGGSISLSGQYSEAIIGDYYSGNLDSLTVSGGSTVSQSGSVYGAIIGSGIVSVSGASTFSVSSLSMAPDTGFGAPATGSLSITGASNLAVANTVTLGANDEGQGTEAITVSGGSTASVGSLTTNGGGSVTVTGGSVLNVTGGTNVGVGGAVNVDASSIANFSNGLNVSGSVAIGDASGGTLSLANGQTTIYGGSVLVGLASSPLGASGGLAVGANGDLIVSASGSQTAPDIITTGALQLGGTLQVDTSSTNFTMNSFIPLIESTSTNLGNSITVASTTYDAGTGDDDYSVDNSQGTLIATIDTPALANGEQLVPALEQSNGQNILGLNAVNSCASILNFNGGSVSVSTPTGITLLAAFSPVGGVNSAEQACNFSSFNWMQTVEIDPTPPVSAATGQQLTPPYPDPPLGGYLTNTGEVIEATEFPFYYSAAELASGFCANNAGGADIPILAASTLTFCDTPASPNIAAGQYVVFQTILVGICAVPIANVCGLGGTDPLYEINWDDNFNGCAGAACDGGAILQSQFPVVRSNLDGGDPDSGTGGVNVLWQGPQSVPEPPSIFAFTLGVLLIIFSRVQYRPNQVCSNANGSSYSS